nr:regulation of nuclear pre-mRNA domain-containing protein 1A [Ipomoea trifida]
MGSTFNPQILVEKLAKLNSSQQSIETLSHWCIFHMNKAKQVVETWDRQFHSAPREQRLAFLYLANDILQNSRRKGSEFVGEFWKVLPGALRKVIDNGDEFGRNAALRLIDIWEERKVFGSRGQILKEEFAGKHGDPSNRNGKPSGFRLRPSAGNGLDKIVSSYHVLYGGQLDEDALLTRCRNAINSVEKIDKEIGGDLNSGHLNGSGFAHELKGQQTMLRECIEQLMMVESSRANLVSQLKEALREQEYKLELVRSELQAAQSHSEQATNICKQLVNGDNAMQILGEHGRKDGPTSQAPPRSFVSGSGDQSAPMTYTRQVSFGEKAGRLEEDPKSAAAAVAAKLTASTSSAQMLTYVLSSLASEGMIGSNQMKESATDYPAEKRAKLENEHSAYVPQNPQTTLSISQPVSSPELIPNEQPPPPSSPPPMPPLPPMQPYPQYLQSPNGAFTFATSLEPPAAAYPQAVPPMNGLAPYSAPPANAFQVYQPPDSGFYTPQSTLPMAPAGRQ